PINQMQRLRRHARRVGGLLYHPREATERRGEHLGHSIIAVYIHTLENLKQWQGTVPHERRLYGGTKRDYLNGTRNGEPLPLRSYHTVPLAADTLRRWGECLFKHLPGEGGICRKVHKKIAADN